MSTAALPATTLAPVSILQRLREFALPMAAISVIFVMLVPLPSAALDFLLALSMAASIVVFLSAVQIRRGGRALGLSHLAAVTDPLPAGLEYRLQPPYFAAWFRRNGRRRQRSSKPSANSSSAAIMSSASYCFWP